MSENSSGIRVRPIEKSDYEQWRPLWDGYNAFYERHGPTALPEPVTAALWDRFFDDGELVYGMVAEQDGRIVGLVHYLYHRSTTSIERACYLQDLFTEASLRGKGVGRALIDAVRAEATGAGSPRLYWHTHKTNETAMTLYDKVAVNTGFVMYAKKA